MSVFPSGGLFPSPDLYPSGTIYPAEGPDPLTLVPDPPSVDPPIMDEIQPFMLASKFVQSYLHAVALELGRIEQARQELFMSWFPATSGTVLEFFEQILGLPINSPSLTLAQRRAAVLAFMQAIHSQGTGTEWQATLSQLIGTTWSYEQHTPGSGSGPPAYTILLT